MPSRKAHVYVDNLFFGKSYWKIHKEMDKGQKSLGRYHRILYHDPPSAIAIARRLCPNDPKAIRAAFLHITIDKICTKNPELGKTLEMSAISRSGKKKRRRKRKKTLS